MRKDSYDTKYDIAARQNIKERDYWLNKLAGDLVTADFPHTGRIPPVPDTNKPLFDTVTSQWDQQLSLKLMKLSNQSDFRLHIILVASLALLIYKYTAGKDIIIGIPIYRQEVEGELINKVLALRNQINANLTFKEFLLQAAKSVFEANENQNYPLETLLYRLDLPPISKEGDCPLFNIALLLENIHDRQYLHPIQPKMVFLFNRTGDCLEGKLEYNTLLYEKKFVQGIINHFSHLLAQCVSDINMRLSDLDMLSEKEKKQLIADFNDNRLDFPGDKTIHQWVEKYAESSPEGIAVSFNEDKLDYRELNGRASKLAGVLQKKGIGPDKTIGILLERCPLMIESILAAWKAGGAYIPLDTNYPVRRTLEILNDSNTGILITRAQYVEPTLEKEYAGIILTADKEPEETKTFDFKAPEIDMNSLAYVIYTSGSTGKPKGAMVEHKGMMNHIWAKVHDLKLTGQSIVVQNAAHTFDISVWQFCSALAVGGQTVIYPEEVILDPKLFIARLVGDRTTILEVVPSYLAVLLDYIKGHQTPSLSIHYLLVTGEVVKPALVARWFDTYDGIKMVNAYGPTEASDDITHHIMDRAPEVERIPIGKTLHNLNIYIVDKNMKLCPVGVKGEICVSGVGVGRGYLNNPELTAEKFDHDLWDYQEGYHRSHRSYSSYISYKTGDLGRWLPDGTIEFFGRKDYQVKIRGFRIELGEIENKLAAYPKIRDVVVIDKEDEQGVKYLCAYIVNAGSEVLNTADIKRWLRERLPEYMLPAHFIPLEQMPLTSSGKIDRKALPHPEFSRNSTMEYISDQMLRSLKDAEKHKQPRIVPGEMPGKILASTAARLEKEKLVLDEYSRQTGKNYYLLSYPQKMIYFIDKKHIGTGCSNIVFFVRYPEVIDADILEEAVNKIVYKHQSLRLKIVEVEHESGFVPGQYASPFKRFNIPRFDFSTRGGEEELQKWLEKQGAKAFELLGGDLFFFAHVKISEQESGCYMRIHNIVSDGLTFHILIKEINRIYRDLKAGKTLDIKPGPPYLDFVSHEQDYLKSARAREDMKFFLEHMLPPPQEVNLSPRVLGDDLGRIDADCTKLVIPAGLRRKLHDYSRTNKVSWYKVVLAALSIYIYRVLGLDDVVIGSLVNNRARFKYIKTAGIFIHFLPLRIRIDRNTNFDHFVKKTGAYLDDIIANRQSYPFELLASQLREQFGVDPGYFYNVNLIGYPDLENVTMERPFSGFEEAPLSLYCNRYNKDIHGTMEFEWIYRRGSFLESEIEQMHGYLENVLNDALDNPGKKIGQIELLSRAQKEGIFNRYANAGISSPPYKIGDHRVKNPVYYVLSETGMLQPEGIPGELCIGGENLTDFISGEKEETFFPEPFTKGRIIYRTGQLAKRLSNENIEYLGRINEQVWSRGTRVNSREIKNALLKHEAIKDAEVVIKESFAGSAEAGPGDFGKSHRYLCGFIVSEKVLVPEELMEYLSEQLPPYMVPSYFIQLEKMPVTPEGETDRKVLSALDIEGIHQDQGFEAPANPIEEKLAEIWHELLGIEKDKISINANFFDLGGHSLKAISAVSKIHKEFNVKISLEQVFKNPTIRGLSEYIIKADECTFTTIEPAEKRDYYTISSAQRRLYFVQQFDLDSTTYNMPRVLMVPGELDIEKLEKSFIKLIERHESLRTSFEMINEEAVQKISETVDFEIEYNDLQVTGADDRWKDEGTRGLAPLPTGNVSSTIQDFIRPFDLSRAPLLRVGLIKLDEEKHILMTDMHHIISDGVSSPILTQDFFAIYNGEELPPLKLQYRDYSQWQNSNEQKKILGKQEEYWIRKFSDEIPVLSIPLDFPRPGTQRFEGSKVNFEIDVEKTKTLSNLAGEENTTLYSVLLAVYNVLFARITGQEDIIVGSPTAGRRHADLEKIIGVFVNTLAIRNYPLKEKTFIQFLKDVKKSTLDAFENQDYHFEDLVEKISINRDISHNPLFDVVFSLQNLEVEAGTKSEEKRPDINGEYFQYEHRIAKFDLCFDAAVGEKLYCSFEYSTNLFKEETIKRFVKYFKTIVSSVIEAPGKKISRLEIIPHDEKKRLLSEFNNTSTEYPKDKTMQELLEARVVRNPDNTAVVFQDRWLTYRGLNQKANRLVSVLREKRVKPGGIVGIMVEPSLEMIIAIFGIWKAGGAYLPIDPRTPSGRVTDMLQESGASVLLTSSKLLANHSFTALQDQASTRAEPRITPARERITDMDWLPLTDRSMIDYNKYNQYIGYAGVKHSISLEATRGCPYNCTYCHKIFPNKQVSRSAENIFSEVQHYYNLGVRRFSIIDDIFNLNKKISSRFFQLIIKNGLNKDLQLFFSAGLRGDILTNDYIDLMVEAGTVNVSPALETASPRLQKLIGKNLNIEKFRRNVEYFCEKYPQVITELFLMHGFPTETEEEARQTIEFVKSLKWIHFPYINILRIYSTTRMAKLAMKHGIPYESIIRSEDLAWHELPETLPFPKGFTMEIQTEFLNEYFLSKERLLHMLPYQMQMMTEDELVQKYDSYLPVDIDSFSRLLEFTGIKPGELDSAGFLPQDKFAVPDLNEKLRNLSPGKVAASGAIKVLLLDLNLYFSRDTNMLYDLLNEPLGLMRLMTQLQQEFGKRINGKIAKSRINFNSYEEFRALLEQFKPDVIGIRTLTFYRDFVHKTISLIRQWGINVPIIVGGPHVTTNYQAVLQDQNIDLAVLGEGEITLVELMEKILDNHGKLPDEKILEKIPGLAFIPRKERRKQQFVREIIMLDAADVNNGILSKQSEENPVNINRPGDLAYVIFTSGSTGKPKGVMVEHRNLLAYINAFCREFEITTNDTVIQQASFAFDVFMEEVYPVLSKGGKVVILSKEEFLDIPLLVETIQKNEVSIISCSPLLLNELNKYNTLSPIHTFISGGDVLKGEYVDKLLKTGKVYNTYGPTETTVCITYHRCINAFEASIPIGKPISNYKVYILDRGDNFLPIGIPGELCAAGAGVTRGYLNNPELTAEKFKRAVISHSSIVIGGSSKVSDNPSKPSPNDLSPMTNDRLYKTGDLARWLPEGNIEFLGRIDHQVKIRGFRIELGEIELQLLRHDQISEAVVVARQDKDSKYLCAYVVPNENKKLLDLRNFLSDKLPAYMLPAYFVQIDELPLTPNGNIDKKALPIPVLVPGDQYVAPGNEIEKKLVEIWEKVIGMDNIGINDNFFEIGGDSIKTLQIISRMKKAGYNLEMRDIFQNPQISQLVPYVKKIERIAVQSTITGTIPLTPIQKWFFENDFADKHHFNQALMLYWSEGLDEKTVKAVFGKIQEHHDALRMSYKQENGRIIQTNHPLDYPLAIEVYDFRNRENAVELIENKAQQVQASIDLGKGPLMKLALLHADDGDRLLVVIHHLVVDGVSWRILFEDIETLIQQHKRGEQLVLPLKSDSFKRWVKMLSQYANSDSFLEEKAYWQGLESQAIPVIKKDFQEENNYLRDRETFFFTLNQEETGLLLTKVNEAFGTRINDILLTALGWGVKETFGNKRLLIAMEGHGREDILRDMDISRTVGWFTSIYPVLLEFSYENDLARQIKEVKESLRRIPHKGIGYGLLKYLTSGKHLGQLQLKLNPQIIFDYLGQFDKDIENKSYAIARESSGRTRSINQHGEFEIEVSGIIDNKSLRISITYNTKQYKTETMDLLINHYKKALSHIIAYCSSREKRELTPSDFSYPKLSIDTLQKLQEKYSYLIEDINKLTPMQLGKLFYTLYDRSSSGGSAQLTVGISGKLNVSLFERSINELFKRYDILRTTFVYDEIEVPIQIILKERRVDFLYEDIRKNIINEDYPTVIDKFVEKDRKRSFDLETDVLMRVSILQTGDTQYKLLWSFHHILTDGWCLGILFRDFLEIYNSFMAKRPYQLPPVQPYKKFLQWLARQDETESEKFWKKYLEGFDRKTSIPKRQTVKENKDDYHLEKIPIILNETKTSNLYALTGRNQITLNTILQTIWGIILSKYNQQEDVVFGAVVSGRPSDLPGVESMVGLFINTIPVRISCKPGTPFKELAQQVQAKAVESEPYHHYSLSRIQAVSTLKQNLLDHVLVFENYPVAEQVEGIVEAAPDRFFDITGISEFTLPDYNLHLVVHPGDALRIEFRINTRAYERNFIKELASQVEELVDMILHDSDIRLEDIKISDKRPRAKIHDQGDYTEDFGF